MTDTRTQRADWELEDDFYLKLRDERYPDVQAIYRERFAPLAVERTRPMSKATGQVDDHEGRRHALNVAMTTRVPVLTTVEFRNNPAKAPWLSNHNRAEAG